MKHTQFKEWLQLSAVNELNDDEQALLDLHVKGCSECRAELSELKRFQTNVARYDSVDVSDALLQEARQQLHSTLLEIRLKKSSWKESFDAVREFFFYEHKFAFGGLAMTAVGIIIGYIVFVPPAIAPEKLTHREPPTVQLIAHTEEAKEAFIQEETRTSNLHFIDSDAGDGVIEFTFDAVTPMRVRGNVNDDKVQKVLARALTNEENAGVRLRTVGAIATGTDKGSDPEVKAALISALKADLNPGVRQEALRILLRYPLDKEIKQALMFTLNHDKNSGNRIAAINGLASASMEGHTMDRDVLKLLKQKTESDNNNYVRRQARTVIQEVAYR